MFAILRELIGWWLRYGEVNNYYYLYGLDRVDAKLDDYLPYRKFRAIRNSRNLQPDGLSRYYGRSYNFVCVLRDKYLFSILKAGFGFAANKVIAICSPDSLFWVSTGQRTSLDDLVADSSLSIDGMLKPVDGIMGSNVFPLKIANGRLYIDGLEASVDELRSRLSKRHILEARLKQHPEVAKLHPWSINTLRLVTFNQDGQVLLFSAALRIGTGRRSTDNWSAGGILVAVEPKRGITHGDGYMKPAFGRRVSRHPDTDIELSGFKVTDYERAVDSVLRLHAQLPGLHSVGWDVAITRDGPVIIEGNDDWDGAIPMTLGPHFRQKFMQMY